jgi:hypothetical protein
VQSLEKRLKELTTVGDKRDKREHGTLFLKARTVRNGVIHLGLQVNQKRFPKVSRCLAFIYIYSVISKGSGQSVVWRDKD